MRNLLQETLDDLAHAGKTPSDVRFVMTSPYYTDDPAAVGSWADFESLANVEYDAGYGGAEIQMRLKIVGDDWWLERGEYDGSEWWEFKSLPTKPDKTMRLRAEDILERP